MKTIEKLNQDIKYHIIKHYKGLTTIQKFGFPINLAKKLNKTPEQESFSLDTWTCILMLVASETNLERRLYAVLHHLSMLPATMACETLYKADNSRLFTVSNCKLLLEQNDPERIEQALKALHEGKILTQTTFNRVINHENLADYTKILQILIISKILTQDNCALIHDRVDLEALLNVFTQRVRVCGTLTQTQFLLLVNHRDLEYASAVLQLMDQYELFLPAEFNCSQTIEQPANLDELRIACRNLAGKTC